MLDMLRPSDHLLLENFQSIQLVSHLVPDELDLAETTLAKISEGSEIIKAESLLWLCDICFIQLAKHRIFALKLWNAFLVWAFDRESFVRLYMRLVLFQKYFRLALVSFDRGKGVIMLGRVGVRYGTEDSWPL